MIENNELQNETAEDGMRKWIWLTAVSTGALFWASLFGLILVCLRA
jgi:hypothetical protein